MRTGSTAVAMGLCVFLFCTLLSVLAQFDPLRGGPQPAPTGHPQGVGVISSLPMAYGERIKDVPGVTGVAATQLRIEKRQCQQ